MRYYLIDKIIHYINEKEVHGIKAVTLTDPILHDHFPDYPIFPGALILEGVAQTAGFLLETSFNKTDDYIRRAVFVQADKYKISMPTGPGELLRYEIKLISTLDDAGRVSFEVKSHLNNEIRAKGNITFKMMDINSENISKQRVDLYKIWTKDLENCPELR
jgi:3-hydroxyacyl-[acyl-carrier-protein] dehydratase